MLLSCIIIYQNRRSGAAVNRLLDAHFLAHFHTAGALSAPAGHLPLEGKADDTRIPYILKLRGASQFLCAAPPPVEPLEPLEPLEPIEPIEPAPPLSQTIKGQYAPPR